MQHSRLPLTKVNFKVWIEEAEEGFVDSDENLETGEVCLDAIKAFASNPDNPLEDRFLCAGALVQRPIGGEAIQLHDAWIADSILDEGGPNLQKMGALLVLDRLFLNHLKRNKENPILAIRSFVVHCSADSDFTCASSQAILDRGFRSVQSLVEDDQPTIYSLEDYLGDGLDGVHLLDVNEGIERYKELAASEEDATSIVSQISRRFPDKDTIQQCTLGGTDVSRNYKLVQHLLKSMSSEQ